MQRSAVIDPIQCLRDVVDGVVCVRGFRRSLAAILTFGGDAPMRRVALLCLGLVVGAASAAEAQLTMQMGNGWSFTFAGNVNAFLVYDDVNDAGLDPLGGEAATGIRTGLLPAFAVLDAKGKEGSTDLGVHFGFAPQIQCGYNAPAPGGAATGGGRGGGQGDDCFRGPNDKRAGGL